MEIKFNEDDVKQIILEHARKIFPEANHVSGRSYSRIPNVTVSYHRTACTAVSAPVEKGEAVYEEPL